LQKTPEAFPLPGVPLKDYRWVLIGRLISFDNRPLSLFTITDCCFEAEFEGDGDILFPLVEDFVASGNGFTVIAGILVNNVISECISQFCSAQQDKGGVGASSTGGGLQVITAGISSSVGFAAGRESESRNGHSKGCKNSFNFHSLYTLNKFDKYALFASKVNKNF
jgi:hypothetical protein